MTYESRDDLIHRYVAFIFHVYALDTSGWITKDPPSIEEYKAMEIIEEPWIKEI
jgi:hypothetical protein